MSDDLIERLNAALGETSPLSTCYLMEEAVARITELEAQLTEAINTERAAVVAYLKEEAESEKDTCTNAYHALTFAAMTVEEGDHVRTDLA